MKLFDQLLSCVFCPKTKKGGTDGSSSHGLMLPARDLSITWGDDKRYWQWNFVQDTRTDVRVEVAELIGVCWFAVHAKFDTLKLSPGTTYQVFFVVMLKHEANGWQVPVNLRLDLSNGQTQERKETLLNMQKDEWIEIQVGEFSMSREVRHIDFSMTEVIDSGWKRGLVIKGAVIRPKK